LSEGGKNKILKQLPNGSEEHVHGRVHKPANDLVSICLSKITRSSNRYFCPLSFNPFLSWPLITSNVLNVGGFL
jgi:hypothetical protein